MAFCHRNLFRTFVRVIILGISLQFCVWFVDILSRPHDVKDTYSAAAPEAAIDETGNANRNSPDGNGNVNRKYIETCERQNHVVYIKSHKTGSTTVANMFWRLSLRRGVHMLTFDVLSPFIAARITPYLLGSHLSLHPNPHPPEEDPSLHKHPNPYPYPPEDHPSLQSHPHPDSQPDPRVDHRSLRPHPHHRPRVEMAAEHMVYREEELDALMPLDTVYVSSLRDPVNQLVSTLNYFQIPREQFNITAPDPARELILNIEKYIPNKGYWKNCYYNTPNAYILGMDPAQFHNATRVRHFIAETRRRFGHMLITEHYDESLIVMRRKLCWEISDILYLPLRIGNHGNKDYTSYFDIREKVRILARVDFLLHEMFNSSLWRDLAHYGRDFWDEFKFYSKQKIRIVNFCRKIIQSIKLGSDKVEDVLNLKESLVVPESPWGREYIIDHVWCLVSKLNMRVFRNIIRVHEYPELCRSLSKGSRQVPLTDFQKNRTDPYVLMNPAFCSGKRTSKNRTFQIPLDVLLATDLYNI